MQGVPADENDNSKMETAWRWRSGKKGWNNMLHCAWCKSAVIWSLHCGGEIYQDQAQV